MVIGTADPVEGAAALDALHLLAEHLMPDRWAEVREPTRRKLAATLVQRVALAEASVKLGAQDADTEPDDGEDGRWVVGGDVAARARKAIRSAVRPLLGARPLRVSSQMTTVGAGRLGRPTPTGRAAAADAGLRQPLEPGRRLLQQQVGSGLATMAPVGDDTVATPSWRRASPRG